MAQINTCIKRTFTIFNILFAIVGGIVLLLALACQIITRDNDEDIAGRTTGLIFLYLVGAATVIIAILGAVGAHKENKVCLIIFLVCMVIGTLLMFRGGVTVTSAQPYVREALVTRFRSLLPLDKSTEEVKAMADTLQTTMHCCGLFNYKDWEDEIPDSCLCSSLEEGQCQTISYSSIFRYKQTKTIYKQACFPLMLSYIMIGLDIVIGIFFGLGVLALLGMILASIMIHQMNRALRSPNVMVVPAVFTSQPPKYEELKNPPLY